MDLWDLTKMLFRRWYIFTPVLLASMGLVLAMAQTVKPDYSATGHLQLIPPNERVEKGQVVKVNNRWLDLGFPALGSAVILQSQTEQVLSELTAKGYTDNFTVTMEYGTTYLTIEAIGSSKEQAVGTVQALMKEVDEMVGELQEQFDTTKQDQITTLALDQGDKVEAVTSKKKRVIIVATGIALMLSVGLSIGIDALIRLRRRRAAEAAGGPDATSSAAAQHDSGSAKVPLVNADATVVLRTPSMVSRSSAQTNRAREPQKPQQSQSQPVQPQSARPDETVRIFTPPTQSRQQPAEDEGARAKAAVRPPGRDQGAASVNGQSQGRPTGPGWPGSVPMNGQNGVNGDGMGRQELRK
ncbi:hypothetical protein ACTI_47140 [Actinoplanes sp. OR16]|uniref:hypothetical protein n=1 Tax=Actinoplanes sp. OR16 TaxID=946334 RepID=UPI000F6F8689|nr:hypothetical protein [Actinoplanes sp. OR16]BBH68029.1 hypothetical protein ACTI_47140 [Actinoplanes sp. OR16]